MSAEVSSTTAASTTAAAAASASESPSDIDILKTNADQFFLLINGMMVFLMQAGFAFLEAGAVRFVTEVTLR
jgi:hypothetical protein